MRARSILFGNCGSMTDRQKGRANGFSGLTQGGILNGARLIPK